MRDIFEDVFKNQPLDPTEMARRSVRPQSRRRFYQRVEIEAADDAFRIVLDGRPVRTPARHALAAPTRALAQALAAEWEAQRDVVDPARMPLTRLANTIIDGVVEAPGAVAAEVERYLACDLVFYRASAPAGLVARPGTPCSRGRAMRSARASCWRRESSSSPSPRRRLPLPAPPSRARRGRSVRCIR
jgi:chaperone required for assembly of F1-ATPase